MRYSLYWDDFNRRIEETVVAIKNGINQPVRRVAVFVTDKCNFKCLYCNSHNNGKVLSESSFINILDKYGDTAIIHITGGEPSVVPWLYPLIRERGDKYKFHLNTNAFITPPASYVKRLKISLDDFDGSRWDRLVNKSGAFNIVTNNIKKSIPKTVVSLTYTLTKQNYLNVVEFTMFAKEEFNGLYAIFFSVYKGTDQRFVMDRDDADIFFDNVLPDLKNELPSESLALIEETINEKIRLIKGTRFPVNYPDSKCYISMSERVFSPDGNEYMCSHLYRDNIFQTFPVKHEKCLYGCNQRLVMFNDEVERRLV